MFAIEMDRTGETHRPLFVDLCFEGLDHTGNVGPPDVLSNGDAMTREDFGRANPGPGHGLENGGCHRDCLMTGIRAIIGSSMKNKIVELPDRRYGANHHIWDNNGTWWCHLSLERRSGPAKRVRFSLRTNNVREARKRRDLIMNANEAKAKALVKSWK